MATNFATWKINLIQEWPDIIKLEKEKEVTGIYLSGHPLDNYKLELEHYIDCPLDQVDNFKEGTVKIAGLVTAAHHGISRRGIGYVRFTIQDYVGSFEAGIYREDYQRFKELIQLGQVIYIEGRHIRPKNSDHLFFKV